MSDVEKRLRKIWNDQGISQERQNQLIAEIKAKAKSGAKVGPFTIKEG